MATNIDFQQKLQVVRKEALNFVINYFNNNAIDDKNAAEKRLKLCEYDDENFDLLHEQPTYFAVEGNDNFYIFHSLELFKTYESEEIFIYGISLDHEFDNNRPIKALDAECLTDLANLLQKL